jgi:hypothetical protein
MANSLITQANTSTDCTPGEGGIDLGNCFYLNNQGDTVRDTYGDAATLINLIVRNLFVVSGLILFFMILYAGFKYIEGGAKGAEEAKNVLTTAAIGFMLMFAAFWVVQIIQVITGAQIGLLP